jgi:CheY-specific phosphatase CheX
MNQLSDQVLSEIAARTFENLVFMFALSESEAGHKTAAACVAASVRFDGPVCGRLVVTIDQAMLPVLAANMLGLAPGPEPSAHDQSDALKEVANVLCGNVLPEIAGPEAVFTVRPPVFIEAGSASAGEACAPDAVTSLALEAGTARLALYIYNDDAAAQPAACDGATGSN